MRRTSSVLWIVSGCLGLLVSTGCSSHEARAKAGSALTKSAPIDVDRISHVAPGPAAK